MLRAATDEFAAETELSLGRTPESAVDELKEHHGVGELMELAIHELPHGLTLQQDQEDQLKVYLLGLPPFSNEQAQRDLIMTMATDLARISTYIPKRNTQPASIQ